MARCTITLKSTIFGNNVSHACNRTRRKFKSNIHKQKYNIPLTKFRVNATISRKGQRILDKSNELIIQNHYEAILKKLSNTDGKEKN